MAGRKRYGLTVTEFCRAYNIPEGEFYLLLATGKGPRIMRVGGKIRISPEAADDWRILSQTAGDCVAPSLS